jgi:Na+/H+-translocating membrane pyrophosphatase
MTDKTNWTDKAALAGAAIGSAALAAALLYASRRKERSQKRPAPPVEPPETD